MSNRQTVFFLPVDPMDKEHKDPEEMDLEAPRLARYMHKAWKKDQNTVYWVDINLEERIDVLSNTIERYHSSRTTPSSLCPESYSNGNWRSHIREGICVTSASSKDLLGVQKFLNDRMDKLFNS